MSVIVAETATTLDTASGFYRAEANQLSTSFGLNTPTTLSSPNTVAVTFDNAGNCRGVIFGLMAGSSQHSYTTCTHDFLVELQEDVASTWTTRASKTKTSEEIFGTTALIAGGYLTPFVFTTPYAVDATASKWRFQITASGGSGTPCMVYGKDNTSHSFCTWCDTAVSFTDDDVLICASKVIIDKTASIKGITNAIDTTSGVACWICASDTVTDDGVCLLEWENPATASYTFTIDGVTTVSSHGGFRVGTETNPIATAQQAIILQATTTIGTLTGFKGLGSSSWYIYQKQNLFLYGEVPAVKTTTLDGDAESGQDTLTTTDSTGWAVGDIIGIGKEEVGAWFPNIVPSTIATISDKTITVTPNIGGHDRLDGGVVGVWGKTGIVCKYGSLADYSLRTWCWYCGGAGNVIMNGVSTSGWQVYSRIGYQVPDDQISITLSVTECSMLLSSTNYFGTPFQFESTVALDTPIVFNDNFMFASNASFNSPTITVLRNKTIAICQGNQFLISGTVNSDLDIQNNVLQNYYGNGNLITLIGNDVIFKNNSYFGVKEWSATAGAVMLGNVFNSVNNITDNSFDTCDNIFQFTTTPVINTTIRETTITGTSIADIILGAGYNQAIFSSTNKATNLIVDTDDQSDMTAGSRVAITNNGNVTGNDISFNKYGTYQRCGTGLADTTSHSTTGYAIRFEGNSSTNRLAWDFNVPTGDIANKTMNIGIWVKISSADYYSGTHQLPRLTLDYDNGTVEYKEATETTDWQYINITFTPISTYGQVGVTLSSLTDQTGSSAYVYYDDMSVLYPAGVILNLGNFNTWANGIPVMPPISTLFSAADIWNVGVNTLTADGTLGNRLAASKITG